MISSGVSACSGARTCVYIHACACPICIIDSMYVVYMHVFAYMDHWYICDIVFVFTCFAYMHVLVYCNLCHMCVHTSSVYIHVRVCTFVYNLHHLSACTYVRIYVCMYNVYAHEHELARP